MKALIISVLALGLSGCLCTPREVYIAPQPITLPPKPALSADKDLEQDFKIVSDHARQLRLLIHTYNEALKDIEP